MDVFLDPVGSKEKSEFLEMAILHFRELNPNFVPQPDWTGNYFETITANLNLFLRWVVADGKRVGFMLYGIQPHLFLPRRTGMIYEMYLLKDYRRRGIGVICAREAIRQLKTFDVSKIQLEVMATNEAAAAFWKVLGFGKVSERYVLTEPPTS